MIKSLLNNPLSSDILEQAVANVINAAASEETAFSNILNIERDIIQKAKNDCINLDKFVSINESVNSILGNITEIQRMTQLKLNCLKELVQKIEMLAEIEALEE